MDFSQIQRFLAIVKYGGLSETTKELYISQPALSLSLANLEKELGLKLFFRGRNGLILTKEEEALYSKFQEIQTAFDDLEAEKRKLQQKESNIITLGCLDNPILYSGFFIGDFLHCDGWKVQTICASRPLMVELLRNGQIDFLITAPPLEEQAIGNINLYQEKVVVATSTGHPLAQRDALKLEDLKDVPLFALNSEYYFRNFCDRFCRGRGFEPLYRFEGTMQDFYTEIASHRGADDFAAFCVADSYEAMYGGGGFQRHEIEDVDFTHRTVLSFLVERKVQYRFADFVQQLVERYPAQRQIHEELTKILMENIDRLNARKDEISAN